MEEKNRLALVAALTVLILIAMLTSFGRSLFAQNIPEVTLPDSSLTGEGPSFSGGEDEQHVQQVTVTPDTVQNVIATLSRSHSYARVLTVETFWSDIGSSTTTVQTWVDGGWSHTSQTLPSGLIRHDLVGDGTIYYWYEGDSAYRTAPDDGFAADQLQRIPTYETILILDTASITDAGYESKGGIPCVFAEVDSSTDGYSHRYWVSVDSGLLVAAETSQDGRLVYRMSALGPIQSLTADMEALFTLPDGTVLHHLAP